MTVYNETCNLVLKMERTFQEAAVYNVVPEGGIQVGNQDYAQFVHTRFVSPQDLNSKGTLFGGALLAWFDLDAVNFAHDCVKTNCVFTTVCLFSFTFIRHVEFGARVRGKMKLVHNSASTLTVKGCYECYNGNEWLPCAEGFITLCAVEKEGKPSFLPELITTVDENSADWDFVEKYKKLTRIKRKEKAVAL